MLHYGIHCDTNGMCYSPHSIDEETKAWSSWATVVIAVVMAPASSGSLNTCQVGWDRPACPIPAAFCIHS